MNPQMPESANAICTKLVDALSAVDCPAIATITTSNVELLVPGPRDLDITQHSTGSDALCAWAQKVRRECGLLSFRFHRFFENGCEMMAVGDMIIERHPSTFLSGCAVHLQFEQGSVASFRLFFDTYALDKFRGRMD